jgi:KDO2-lipid IV(A) lauroyltransferase
LHLRGKDNRPLSTKQYAAEVEFREGSNIQMIPKGRAGARDLIRAVKERRSIAMLIDQKMNDGIEVPLLGLPAMTADAIAKLSLQYNYPIIPCQLIRLNNETEFRIKIYPALCFERTEDINKDIYAIILKINQLIGDWIKENPSQWFWFHNRWK